MDFRVPNALKKRDGSTQIIEAGTSGAITSMHEFIKKDGSSHIYVSTDVGLYEKTGATLTLGFSSSNQFDFLTYNDQMWAASGSTFVNTEGSTFYGFAAPPAPVVAGASLLTGGGSAVAFTTSYTFSLYYLTSYELKNGREIPAAYGINQRNVSPTFWITELFSQKPTIGSPSLAGTAFVFVYLSWNDSVAPNPTMIDPEEFGIDKINIYRAAYNSASVPTFNYYDSFDKVFDGNLSDFVYIGSATFGQTLFTDQFPIGNLSSRTYPDYEHPFYTSYFKTFGGSFRFEYNLVPKYLDLYNDALFMSGFTTNPSRLWFSDIGEPETVFPENFIDVVTDDGDKITGTKTYLDQFLIFKEKSFHRLLGDDITNYSLVEVTKEYGCLNNYSIVEAENILYFLDSKGVVKYNGASWVLQSYPIEDTVNDINIEAAKTEAFAIHKKEDNQIWFAVPTGESSENNVILVYDYVLDAWTKHDGLNVSSFAVLKGDLNRRRLHFGSYSGMIHHFSPSFMGDNGQAISCVAHGRYEAPQGQNVEKLFRRLFTDITPDASSSTIIEVKGYKNYDGSTNVYGTTLNQSDFQQRKDFGIPARSMAFEFSHNSASTGFQFNGYGVATRYLRDK